MKIIPPLAFALSVLVFACNNDKKTGNAPPVIVAANAKENASALQEKLDALQQLTPYTPEEMKSLIPVTINDDSAANITSRSSMGTGFASAAYKLSDSTSLVLTIFDCAGTPGAGIYSAQFAGLLNNPGDDNKIIDFKGDKAIEHDDARKNNYSLSWIENDRLLVSLDGKNTGIEPLKEIAKRISLK